MTRRQNMPNRTNKKEIRKDSTPGQTPQKGPVGCEVELCFTRNRRKKKIHPMFMRKPQQNRTSSHFANNDFDAFMIPLFSRFFQLKNSNNNREEKYVKTSVSDGAKDRVKMPDWLGKDDLFPEKIPVISLLALNNEISLSTRMKGALCGTCGAEQKTRVIGRSTESFLSKTARFDKSVICVFLKRTTETSS